MQFLITSTNILCLTALFHCCTTVLSVSAATDAAEQLQTTFSQHGTCTDGSIDAIIAGSSSDSSTSSTTKTDCDAFQFMYDTLSASSNNAVTEALSTVLTDESSSYSCDISEIESCNASVLTTAVAGDKYTFNSNVFEIEINDVVSPSSSTDRYGCVAQQVGGKEDLVDGVTLEYTDFAKRSDPACIESTLELVREAKEDAGGIASVDDDDDGGCNRLTDGNWFKNMWCPIDQSRQDHPAIFWGIICGLIGICLCCCCVFIAPSLFMGSKVVGGDGEHDAEMAKMAMMMMM